MELKLGKMTQKELAEWFGVSYNTFKNHPDTREKRMRILRAFADYHYEGRTVVIDQIYIPEYSRAYNIVRKEMPREWHKNGLDTCARVGKAIYYKNKELASQISITTAQSYTNRVKVEMYGHNHLNDYGTHGYSEYQWGKASKDKEHTAEFLTEEQYKLIKECSTQTFGEALGQKAALLTDALKKGEITEEEYRDGMVLSQEERDEQYAKFCEMVIEKLGFYPDKFTLIHNTAFQTEE